MLIPQIADKLKIPIIAAGGIADGRGIAAALTLGADAVQIGTAFLACEESNATPEHKAKLFSEDAKYTVLTKMFTGRLARSIRNKLSSEMRAHEYDFAPYPIQRMFFNTLRTAAINRGRTDLANFWSGQIAPILKYKKSRGAVSFFNFTNRVNLQIDLVRKTSPMPGRYHLSRALPHVNPLPNAAKQ